MLNKQLRLIIAYVTLGGLQGNTGLVMLHKIAYKSKKKSYPAHNPISLLEKVTLFKANATVTCLLMRFNGS